MNLLSETVENVLAKRPASFSWRVLMSGKPAAPRRAARFHRDQAGSRFQRPRTGTGGVDGHPADRRRTEPRLASLPPACASPAGFALADEEFATVKDGALLNTSLTIFAVLIILWLALRSGRIIVAVFLSLMVGLAITAALGLLMVGAFNLISVAFAVLFVGIGVDFGIQYSVRYRAERHEHDELRPALLGTGAIGRGAADACGGRDSCRVSVVPARPTYRGVSELGLIAGIGMVIAFLTSITLLPALLAIFNPPGEPEPLGYAALAPVDRFLERHRVPILAATGIIVLAGLPLLFYLRFDFNPINLRSPSVESRRDVSGAQKRSGDRHELHRHSGPVPGRGKRDSRAPGETARGIANDDPEQSRARRSGAEAGAHRQRQRKRSRAHSIPS